MLLERAVAGGVAIAPERDRQIAAAAVFELAALGLAQFAEEYGDARGRSMSRALALMSSDGEAASGFSRPLISTEPALSMRPRSSMSPGVSGVIVLIEPVIPVRFAE